MRITITGATGLIGAQLVRELRARGDEVTVLSRSGGDGRIEWDPMAGPAPTAALEGRDAVVHLAGEPVSQRWNPGVKERIRASRETGTRNLVAGIAAVAEGRRPRALVSSSAMGYYGPRGDERLTEESPAGSDFLASVCVAWEREASRAAEHGLRVVCVRTGIVLDGSGGALGKMLLPFKLGVGGPVASGRQYMAWIHADDIVGIYLRAVDDDRWSGPVNGSAPEPVTNKAFAKALGRVLGRPAVAPVPALALKLLYGEMADIVTTGQNAIPDRTSRLGYVFAHTELESALRSALRR